MSDLTHLFTGLLLVREALIPFLSGCVFLPGFSDLNITASLCALPYVVLCL